ncbi:MAG: hypothetical protein INR64_09150 [Caulobacteraceae bacterium]|nr:hypothetical protein [Caulobacter sp.]
MSTGFTADSWSEAAAFAGRVATQADVEGGAAVFALGDTQDPEPLDLDGELPQPAIWYEDDGQLGVLIVQAERHETPDGEVLEALGLLFPDGRTAVGFLDDVDLVDAADPVWRDLVEEALFSPPPSPAGPLGAFGA